MYLVSIHNGRVIKADCQSESAAILLASWNAKELGVRVNVYPVDDAGRTGCRVVSCYRAGNLSEASIADLPHREYLARHEAMAQASKKFATINR